MQDGRALRLVIQASPALASPGMPDWEPGAAAGATVTLTNGLATAVLEYAGVVANSYDFLPAITQVFSVDHVTNVVGGSGYTNGTGYALGISGGGGHNAAGTFDVVGGSVTNVVITNHGTGYTGLPTFTFPGAGSGTGASATAVLGNNGTFPGGTYFAAYTVANSGGTIIGYSSVAVISVASTGVIMQLNFLGGVSQPSGSVVKVYIGTTASNMTLYKTLTYGTDFTVTSNDGCNLDTSTWQDTGQSWPGVSYTRWTANYLIPEANLVQLGDSGLTVSAPAGLFQDQNGNTTAVISNASVTNNSLAGPDGFTAESLVTGAAIHIYISNSHGSETGNFATDWAAGQNISTPLKTFAHVSDLMATFVTVPTWIAIHFLRGDVFPETIPKGWSGKGGISPQQPAILTDYWNNAYGTDPGTYPRIDYTNLSSMGPSGSNCIFRHLWINQTNKTTGTGTEGFSWANTFSNITIDDCIIQSFGIGGAYQFNTTTPGGDYSRNVTLMRTRFLDCYDIGIPHTQGFFCEGVEVYISHIMVHNCGWKSGDFTQSDTFSHGTYITSHCLPHLAVGSVYSHCGGSSLQGRAGGNQKFMVHDDSALGSFEYGPAGGGFLDCVFMSGHDLSGSGNARGLGLNIGSGSMVSQGGYIERCVLVDNGPSSGANQPEAIIVTLDQLGTTGQFRVRNNTAISAGVGVSLSGSFPTPPTANSVLFSRNVLDCGSYQIYSSNYSVNPADQSYYSGSQNLVNNAVATNSQCIFQGANASFANYSIDVSSETGSIFGAITYTNSLADMATYAQTLGLGLVTKADLINYWRARPPRVWNSTYDPVNFAKYMQQQTAQTSHGRIDSSPNGFYGAFDATSGAAATAYTLTGPGTGTVGTPVTLTLTPNGTVNCNVTLSDGGAGGTFGVSPVNMTGLTTVTYTPARSGTITITATNDGGLTDPSPLVITVSTVSGPAHGYLTIAVAGHGTLVIPS